jgi:hypothetical protein
VGAVVRFDFHTDKLLKVYCDCSRAYYEAVDRIARLMLSPSQSSTIIELLTGRFAKLS